MAYIEITEEEANNLSRGEVLEEDRFQIVEQGDWEEDFKDYHNKTTIFKDVESGKFYSLLQQRTGSYYTDYDFDFPRQDWKTKMVKCIEVEQYEVTITKWREVSKV